MKISFKNFLLIFILIGCLNASAQEVKKNGAHFSGLINDVGFKKTDSLLIVFWKDYVFGAVNSERLGVKVSEKGRFDFNIKNISKPTRIMIFLFSKGEHRNPSTYYAESGDDVRMDITRLKDSDNVVFSGKGSAKYELITLLSKENQSYETQEITFGLQKIQDTVDLSNRFKQIHELTAKFQARKLALIELHEKNLSNEMRLLLECDFANYYNSWDSRLYSLSINPVNQKVKEFVKNIFNRYKDEFSYIPKDIMEVSHDHISYYYYHNKIDIYMNSSSGSYKMEDLYVLIKNKYRGVLRDKILGYYFLVPSNIQFVNNYSQVLSDSLMLDAYNLVVTPTIKKQLFDKIKLKKGTPIYHSDFTDSLGRNFNTASLNGKVVLIEMWGEGCTGCAMFHSTFEKHVYPLFKDNKNFVILSISVDKKRERWMTGLESGRYSSKEDINVYTGGLGMNHPWLQYYSIKALPFLLLVDRFDNVIASFSSSIENSKLIGLINEALNDGASENISTLR